MKETCPSCGASVLPTGDAFCAECRQPLDDPDAVRRGDLLRGRAAEAVPAIAPTEAAFASRRLSSRLIWVVAFLALLGLVAGIGYVLLRPGKEAEAPALGGPPIQVKAEELSEAYQQNGREADARFKNRLVEVSGEVIGRDGKSPLHIVMMNDLSVDCIVPERNLAQFVGIMPNAYVVIKGVCKGKQPTKRMLIVVIEDCELVRVVRLRRGMNERWECGEERGRARRGSPDHCF